MLRTTANTAPASSADHGRPAPIIGPQRLSQAVLFQFVFKFKLAQRIVSHATCLDPVYLTSFCVTRPDLRDADLPNQVQDLNNGLVLDQ